MVKKIFDLLTPEERRQSVFLFGLILLMALLDTMGVASIIPFMALLANPELVETNSVLKAAYVFSSRIGITTGEQFLFVFGVFIFILLLVSLALKAVSTWVQLRFASMCEFNISKRLVDDYLNQPYSWFLGRHSADLGKNILSEVHQVVVGGLMPLMYVITHSVVAGALIIMLMLVDLTLALIVGTTLVAAYAMIFKISRDLLSRIGAERMEANQARYTVVDEAFGGWKEIKLGGLEETYIERFSRPAETHARHQATAQLVSQIPRFALEAIAFGGMLLLVLYLMGQTGQFSTAVPIIAAYAFAGYRLIPSLQQIYAAATHLRFVVPALEALHAELTSLQSERPNIAQQTVVLREHIVLSNIQYRYPSAQKPALESLSLTIPAKSTVGLVGTTGSGKTTVVDLILGLLEPQEGMVEVDGEPITQFNRRSWNRSVGYVPQQIYLIDDTVAANIAFGMNASKIDHSLVEQAARAANLHQFVTNELPQQYQTIVGERGIRLSGGQRQRIGIARALYHSPQVLIMDEATSALDNTTEGLVMDAVHNLKKNVTIILIAHRLSTVKVCDQIYLLEQGTLKDQGTYEELVRDNEIFRSMARREDHKNKS